MILEKSQLDEMTVKELIRLSYETGCVIENPAQGKETIIQQLLAHAAKEPEAALESATEAKAPEPAQCTIEQVKEALAPYLLRGMKLFHGSHENTWLIRVRMKSMRVRDSLTGDEQFIERWRDDSGTLNQPLDVIKRCARVLMQNAPTPEQIKPQQSIPANYEAVA